MPTEQPITLQQGDTKRWVVPVLDGNNPDRTFEPSLSTLDIEFAISEGATGPVLVNETAVTTETKPFSDVEPGVESFDLVDSIPDSQDVLVITVPASETAALLPGEETLEYQIRLTDSNTSERVTVVVGSIAINESPIE